MQSNNQVTTKRPNLVLINKKERKNLSSGGFAVPDEQTEKAKKLSR